MQALVPGPALERSKVAFEIAALTALASRRYRLRAFARLMAVALQLKCAFEGRAASPQPLVYSLCPYSVPGETSILFL